MKIGQTLYAASALCVLAVAASRLGSAAEPDAIGFLKGHSWGWTGRRGEYASPAADESMRKLADTGADSVCIAFATTMRNAETPKFGWSDDNPRMVSDDEIRRAIQLARDNDLKVILKPVVNCRDGTWRAWIRFFRPVTDEERAAGVTGELDPWGGEPTMRAGEVTDREQWERWWECYRGFLLHYARIAQEENVEVFCLGCEMNSTEAYKDRWRQIIAEVRDVYDGLLTYNANHGRERDVSWWDAVDFISVSAYYPVEPPEGETVEEATQRTTTVEEIVAQLKTVKDELAALSDKCNKPILFIETGVTSVRGCARYPWAHPDAEDGDPIDQQEQANYYQAMFEVFWDEPWFMGFAWWDWPARLYPKQSAANHRGFCIYGKQAEQVLRDWYAKPRNTAAIP